MEQDMIIITFIHHKTGQQSDLELPLDISANELIVGLNQGYTLGMDVSDLSTCFLRSEQPIALLQGSKTLREYGLRSGSVIHYL